MSVGLYSHTTRATGTVLTAAIYNSDHQAHITNANPLMTGAYSDNLTQMQLASDPGGLGSEVLAGNLGVELEQIRFALKRITGKTQWYIAPAVNLEAASVTVIPPFTFAHAGAAPINLRRTENDTTARDIDTLQSGSGAGGKFTRQVVGSGGNAVASVRELIGGTEIRRYSSTEILDLVQHQVGTAGTPLIIHYPGGFTDMVEIAAPSNPNANVIRLYAVDVGGVTQLAYRDNTGLVTVLGGQIATRAEMEAASSITAFSTPGRQHFHPGHAKALYGATVTPTAVTGNISSVDTGTDIITWSTTHGLVTGEVMVINGGTWPIPTVVGAYYVNAPSGTTFSLHTTLADALTGANKVNLTSAGSGTRTMRKLVITDEFKFNMAAVGGVGGIVGSVFVGLEFNLGVTLASTAGVAILQTQTSAAGSGSAVSTSIRTTTVFSFSNCMSVDFISPHQLATQGATPFTVNFSLFGTVAP